jgi:hypothetical protein
VEDQSSPTNDFGSPVAKFCLELEKDRRTAGGRIQNERGFREHFFPYDAKSASDGILRFMPREVRGPIIASWGIRGQKAACRDDDARVLAVLHDAFVAGDIDDQGFEDGLSPETVITWADLGDWWRFWRDGKHTKYSIQRALESAYALGLFDAGWFFDGIESGAGKLKGTDVVAEGMSKVELADWIKKIHQSADGSPKGMLAALGWSTLVAKTSNSVLLALIDAFARKNELVKDSLAPEPDPAAPVSQGWPEPEPAPVRDEPMSEEDALLRDLEMPAPAVGSDQWLENPVVPAHDAVDELDVDMIAAGSVPAPTGAIAELLGSDDDVPMDDFDAPRKHALPGLPAGLAKRQKSVPPPLPDSTPPKRK